MSAASASTAFAAAAALHLGFQLTVSVLAYPALRLVRADDWESAHARHTRAITPLVGAVYLAVLIASANLLHSDPSATTAVLVVTVLSPMAITAALAAPLHGRLQAREPRLLHRLLVVDRARTAAALLAAALALAHVLA